MDTLFMGGIFPFMRPITTSLLNINSCSLIARVIVDGLLLPISTYTNISSTITRRRVAGIKIPLFMTSVVTCGGVTGIKRSMSTYFITKRHCKTFFFRIFIFIVTTVVKRMARLTRPISWTSITTHSE